MPPKAERSKTPRNQRKNEQAEIERNSASFPQLNYNDQVKLTPRHVYDARRCFWGQGPLKCIRTMVFTETEQLEGLVAGLLLSCSIASPNWLVGTKFVMKDVPLKERPKLFSQFRSRVGNALRLPCELCGMSVSKEHYQDIGRHDCARQAEYIKFKQAYDHKKAPEEGVIRSCTVAERNSTQRAWELAVEHHDELTMEAKGEGIELAEQIEGGSAYYVLPCTSLDRPRILKLLPDDD